MNLQWIELTIVAAMGLAIGSFLNVVIHRVPRKQSVISPGSRCPSCNKPLQWFDNVPVVSYLALRGRCRSCNGRIGIRYPIVELVTATVFVAHYYAFGWTPLLAVRLLFAAALVALFAIDLEHHLLPDVITLPGLVLGVLVSFFLPPGIAGALLGILVGAGFLWLVGEAYYRYAGVEGMGGGDVKMLGMIGAVLGWQLTLLTLILSSIAGSVVGIAVIALRKGGLKHALPFGTFLAIGALVSSIWGERILAWYLGRF